MSDRQQGHHQVRGFLLGLAKQAGRVHWPSLDVEYESLLRDAYLHGDLPTQLGAA
jgi:hypothetical protein